MTYFDFNSASEQTSFDLIPKGTLVRVRMTIRPGGFDDATQGWVPQEEVFGADNGLKHTFRVTTDLFAAGNPSREGGFRGNGGPDKLGRFSGAFALVPVGVAGR